MGLTGVTTYVAGWNDGRAELLKFHYNEYLEKHPNTNQSWSNPNVSWVNKWAKDENGNVIVGKERFPLSSTLLVFTTDKYHMHRTIRNTAYTASIAIYAVPILNKCNNDYWRKSYMQWLPRFKFEKNKPNRKPLSSYALDVVFITTCRGAGFTHGYNVN